MDRSMDILNNPMTRMLNTSDWLRRMGSRRGCDAQLLRCGVCACFCLRIVVSKITSKSA